MSEYVLAAASALWLGVLTSLSPCPLATNIAAVSYLGRTVGRPRSVLAAGSLYTAGRSLAYVILAWLLVASLLSAPHVSHLLQKYMNRLLGPVLIVTGMFLLELIRWRPVSAPSSEGARAWAAGRGVWGAAPLGLLFALSFCPLSAALFFGSLLPLAVRHESRLLLPVLYGVGTAVPVIVFAILIAGGRRVLGPSYRRAAWLELWGRRITGAGFVGVGGYLSLSRIFGLF